MRNGLADERVGVRQSAAILGCAPQASQRIRGVFRGVCVIAEMG